MGSMGSPNGWASYDGYRDCSRGICSIYCPQWCYLVFPPPPPPDKDSGTTFSPLIIAVIGILASAFLLISYYTIISKYCWRRGNQRTGAELEANRDQVAPDQWQAASAGLDESLIKSITVFKYNKGDGLVEGTDCVVCLSEFQEDESLRLMPNCNHAFHLPCIDTWLKSHSNCPMCRSNVVSAADPSPLPPPGSQGSSALNISSLEIQRRNDVILVVEDTEGGHQERVAVGLVSDDTPKNLFQAANDMENSDVRDNGIVDVGLENVQQFRRSSSLDSSSGIKHLLVADVLGNNEDNKELQKVNYMAGGSSNLSPGEQSKSNNSISDWELGSGPVSMRRSISMNSIIPS